MAHPFDAARALLDALPEPRAIAASHSPATQTGRLSELSAWLRAWPGPENNAGARRVRPFIALYVSAADPNEGAARVARERLEHFAAGGGAVSGMARSMGAGVELFDLALDRPSPDPAQRAAMSERECAATLAFGMEALAKSPDILVLGDASPGGAASAAALGCALAGGAAEPWCAPAEVEWTRTVSARVRAEAGDDPLQILRQIGGRETAALLGALLAARVQSTPVLLDGPCALAAAAVAHRLSPRALDHVQAAHRPAGVGGEALISLTGMRPLLDLDLKDGDGAGGAAALALLRAAVEIDGAD